MHIHTYGCIYTTHILKTPTISRPILLVLSGSGSSKSLSHHILVWILFKRWCQSFSLSPSACKTCALPEQCSPSVVGQRAASHCLKGSQNPSGRKWCMRTTNMGYPFQLSFQWLSLFLTCHASMFIRSSLSSSVVIMRLDTDVIRAWKACATVYTALYTL